AHALAETYAVLTALPLPKRIRTAEARRLIEENILAHMNIVDLEREAYIRALDSAANKGLSSGSIYDALHVEAAIKATCLRIYTYNIEHFRALSPDQIQVTSP
ncbi:MAG: PIN domain-containing protein, partial [Spirochaetales bacterium]|nr:PIN domain-containing protein [Spirochaetales bacterium]MCF7939472.1 PIN domain-containing protein [Spirochaetales bacterium]